jgi:hypothetical protein
MLAALTGEWRQYRKRDAAAATSSQQLAEALRSCRTPQSSGSAVNALLRTCSARVRCCGVNTRHEMRATTAPHERNKGAFFRLKVRTLYFCDFGVNEKVDGAGQGTQSETAGQNGAPSSKRRVSRGDRGAGVWQSRFVDEVGPATRPSARCDDASRRHGARQCGGRRERRPSACQQSNRAPSTYSSR